MKMKTKTKKSWSKGRREPTLLVRLDVDVYQRAKEEAEKAKMTLKAWVSQVIRGQLMKMGH
jgi:predicted HicB family RNase H-like nuclease